MIRIWVSLRFFAVGRGTRPRREAALAARNQKICVDMTFEHLVLLLNFVISRFPELYYPLVTPLYSKHLLFPSQKWSVHSKDLTVTSGIEDGNGRLNLVQR